MRYLATIFTLGCLIFGTALPAWAQPERVGEDVIWARDIAGATITMDGVLDESVWDQADSLELVWGEVIAPPGSGYQIEGTPVPPEPTDPTVATMRVLRDGNILWVGVDVTDASVGGGTSLFNFDGTMMSITDRSQRPDDFAARTGDNYFANGATNAEFALSWWNPADTTDGTTEYSDGTPIPSGSPVPGIEPRFFGDYGVGFNQGNDGDARDANDEVIWNAAAVVDGIANDDTHGDDGGYVFEMRINLDSLGYDMTQDGGDVLPWNVAIQDDDYSWPENQDLSFLSRTFWQNRWLNNFNEGVAYVYGDPSVTVNSGDTPSVTEPVVHVGNGELFADPTIDGQLNDEVWDGVDSVITLQYEMSAEEMDNLPGAYAPYGVSWYRPDINGDGNTAIVVDASSADAQFAFKGNTLYIGVDVDDQAISGSASENGRDGVRFTIQNPDSIESNQTWAGFQFDFSIDSTGSIRYGNEAFDADTEGAAPGVEAAVFLKGASTAADPTNADVGYQIEIALDLAQALGYPDGLGDGQVYFGMNFFDGDFLPADVNSYATRTWLGAERNQGASIYAFLDPNLVIGSAIDEEGSNIPSEIVLKGNYPNPFSRVTTLNYELSHSGSVAVKIFDVLGRQVVHLKQGVQSAGAQEVRLNAANLASGMYIYRIEVAQPGHSEVTSRQGRMLLIK